MRSLTEALRVYVFTGCVLRERHDLPILVVVLISLSCLVDRDVIIECVVKELHPPLRCPTMTLSALRDTCGVSLHKKVNKDIKKTNREKNKWPHRATSSNRLCNVIAYVYKGNYSNIHLYMRVGPVLSGLRSHSACPHLFESFLSTGQMFHFSKRH